MNIIDTKKQKDKAIKKAVEVLKNGGLIVYPTETCYGLGGDATNPEVLKKIMKYKKLRGSKPISIAVANKEMAEKYVEINEMADNLYDNYLPGPITVISMSKGNLVPPVVSIHGAVGIRYPDYNFTLELIKEFGRPITATSANVSYKSAPYNIDQLIKDLPKKSFELIDLFLDAGTLPKNKPSTVLDTTMNQLSVLRQGRIEFEDALIKNKKIEIDLKTLTNSLTRTEAGGIIMLANTAKTDAAIKELQGQLEGRIQYEKDKDLQQERDRAPEEAKPAEVQETIERYQINEKDTPKEMESKQLGPDYTHHQLKPEIEATEKDIVALNTDLKLPQLDTEYAKGWNKELDDNQKLVDQEHSIEMSRGQEKLQKESRQPENQEKALDREPQFELGR